MNPCRRMEVPGDQPHGAPPGLMREGEITEGEKLPALTAERMRGRIVIA